MGLCFGLILEAREKAIRVDETIKWPIIALSLGSVESILSYPADNVTCFYAEACS